ncbi:MAG: acdA, partial [Geobacteraceae bacterium]|nr:acdA [Geobacteraceae bacterium]
MYCDELKKVIGMTVSHGAQFDSVLEPIGVFLREEILPRAAGIDQEGLYPRENLRKLLAPGIPSLPFPKEIGGQGLPYPVYIAALEMLATACANTALQVSIQGMVCEGILHHGNHYQKALFLEQNGLVQGSSLAAFALTEPCCGSDAQA